MSNTNSSLPVGQMAQNLLDAFEVVSSGSDVEEDQVPGSDEEYQESEEEDGGEDEDDEEEEDGSDDGTGAGPVTVPGAAQGFAAATLPIITQGNAPAHALTLADHPWQVGMPKSQPLAY